MEMVIIMDMAIDMEVVMVMDMNIDMVKPNLNLPYHQFYNLVFFLLGLGWGRTW